VKPETPDPFVGGPARACLASATAAAAGRPLALAEGPALFLLLMRAPSGIRADLASFVSAEREHLGSWTRAQCSVTLVLAAAVALWMGARYRRGAVPRRPGCGLARESAVALDASRS